MALVAAAASGGFDGTDRYLVCFDFEPWAIQKNQRRADVGYFNCAGRLPWTAFRIFRPCGRGFMCSDPAGPKVAGAACPGGRQWRALFSARRAPRRCDDRRARYRPDGSAPDDPRGD